MATSAAGALQGESINGQAAIALALLSAWYENRGSQSGGPSLEDVSNRIAIMLDGNIAVNDLGLRRVPGGVYSEEVETFVGHLLAEGLAIHRSPVKLTGRGEELLRMIVRLDSTEHRRAIEHAVSLLKLNSEELLAGLI
jgi:hypothetical protein